jgi:hypothetical protein
MANETPEPVRDAGIIGEYRNASALIQEHLNAVLLEIDDWVGSTDGPETNIARETPSLGTMLPDLESELAKLLQAVREADTVLLLGLSQIRERAQVRRAQMNR